MKKILFLPLIMSIFGLWSCHNTIKPYNIGINITPKPLELTQEKGSFDLTSNTSFHLSNDSLSSVANFFATKIKNSTGYNLKVKQETSSKNYIQLSIDNTIPVNYEGYLLTVTPSGVNVKAKTKQGLFYGMQTVMQLLPAEIESPTLVKNIDWTMPAVSVKDEPRFHYRGEMIDVCRHFFDIDYIKKQLDVLAMYKFNKFHFHLTDDQGWRIEIKKYPELTREGSKRIEGEGNTYGPAFFTQDQIKEIVKYAQDRYIEVIPEIEMPGHSISVLTSHPELGCTGGPYSVRNIWGVANDVLCAGNDSVFSFIENVIAEVAPLFPSQYFHVGGDECPKIRWEKCPKCQTRIKALKLKSDKKQTAEEKLQSYFIQRVEKIVTKYHKKMIGWDEILEGGLAQNATVMSWRGEQGGIDAGNMDHDVIMVPNEWLYLDHYQGDSKNLPVTIGGYTTLSDIYKYDPVPKGLNPDKVNHILGTQGNLWAEYLYNPQIAESRAYPRLIALSEVAWTQKDKKDYKDFERRLDNQRVRLDMHSINYYIPLPEQADAPSCNYVAFTDSVTLAFKTTEPVKMVYTTNGTEPTATSTVYTKPLIFKQNTTLKIRSVLLSGKMSTVRTITVQKESYAPAVLKPKMTKSGLKAEYFKGLARRVSEIAKVPTETEYIAAPKDAKHRIPNVREYTEKECYNTILTGYFNIAKDGVYYFSSNDEQVWIDGKLLINNANEVKRFARTDKSIALAKGYHSIKIVELSDIVGGWPCLWSNIEVSIRESNEPKFKIMDASFFK